MSAEIAAGNFSQSKHSRHLRELGFRELEFEDRQVFAHVDFGACAGQRRHTDLRQVAEQHLGRGALVFFSQDRDRPMGQSLRIRAERPEALLDHVLLATICADVAVVARIGVEPVLYDRRLYANGGVQGLELRKLVAVADSQLPYFTGIHQHLHCLPCFVGLPRCRQG